MSPRFTQALGWQVITGRNVTLIDKNGGLNNSSTYIGFIPSQKIGIVLLSNRGRQPATKVGRRILFELAQEAAEFPVEGADPD